MPARSRGFLPLLLVAMLAACSTWRGGDQEAARPPAVASAPVANSSSTAWGCSEPQPGHPTTAEKQAFVDEAERLATTAEQRHGVPAAAIAAMAIQESGYGWTRLAQETNNLLAWKYVSDQAAGGRKFWVLDCPGRRSTDRFVVFADRAEAVDFVAEQLASSDNYRAATERYRRDRKAGGNVAEAVDRWVDDIADPYSSQPEAYRAALRRVMNDPFDPSDQRSPERNLYRLSESARPAQG
jgi:hypothetical protein